MMAAALSSDAHVVSDLPCTVAIPHSSVPPNCPLPILVRTGSAADPVELKNAVTSADVGRRASFPATTMNVGVPSTP